MSQYLISVFQDTQRILWGNEQLFLFTRQAVTSTQVYPEEFDTTGVMGGYGTEVYVTEEETLHVARKLAEQHMRIGVLNCANAVNPGGGVELGGTTLEEDLCRCSNLYACLMKPEIYENYYGYNNRIGVYYSDRVVYSPDVTVFKENIKNPVYTDAWFQIDVLTCSAPNLNGITVPDYQKLKKIYRSRMRNILAIAQSRGIQVLVLSDFGCGEYRNPPQLVAEAFAEELFQGDFRNAFQKVIFSIKTDGSQGKYNFQVFQATISPWQKNPLYGKKISVLGDFISTYCWLNMVQSMGGTLLEDSSFSDETVSGNTVWSGNCENRLYRLANTSGQPEVILVALGANDYGYGVPVAPDEKTMVTEENYRQYFKTSYQMMLWRLRQMYPAAQIYCGTLCYGVVGESTANPYPKGLYGMSIKKYNRVIRECAHEYGCRVADLEKYQGYYDTQDGLHPTGKGMEQLAEGWIQAIEAATPAHNPLLEIPPSQNSNIGKIIGCGVGSGLLVAATAALLILL